MKHVLEADGMQLSFDLRQVLSDIYLKCETGKITGLLGRNGEGKSCLMRIIYGSMKTETRSVRFDKKPIFDAFKHPELLIYLPQHNFIPGELKLGSIFEDFKLDYQQFENQFSEYRNLHKIEIGKLSGGGKRLVELYLIVMAKSQFAMLDEPFTHLSPIQLEKAKELLLEAKKEKGILTTDHMYSHIIGICDNLYLLRHGKTHLIKTVNQLSDLGYLNPFTMLEEQEFDSH